MIAVNDPEHGRGDISNQCAIEAEVKNSAGLC
jgi:hypothetical protein